MSSSNGNSPAQDFVKSGGPFVTTNGTKVADDWQDLITSDGSGYLDNAITFDEDGFEMPTDFVWTGTDENGMPKPVGGGLDFCDDWKSASTASNKRYARIGLSSFTSHGWTSAGFDDFCGNANRLYCFEQ